MRNRSSERLARPSAVGCCVILAGVTIGSTACGSARATSSNSGTGNSAATTVTTVGTTTTSLTSQWPPIGMPQSDSTVILPPFPGQFGELCMTLDSLVARGGHVLECSNPPSQAPGRCLPTNMEMSVSTGDASSFASGAAVPFSAAVTNEGATTCAVNTAGVGFLVFDLANDALVWDNEGPLVLGNPGIAEGFLPVEAAVGVSVAAPDSGSWDGQTCPQTAATACGDGGAVAPGQYALVVLWQDVGAAEATFTIT